MSVNLRNTERQHLLLIEHLGFDSRK